MNDKINQVTTDYITFIFTGSIYLDEKVLYICVSGPPKNVMLNSPAFSVEFASFSLISCFSDFGFGSTSVEKDTINLLK